VAAGDHRAGGDGGEAREVEDAEELGLHPRVLRRSRTPATGAPSGRSPLEKPGKADYGPVRKLSLQHIGLSHARLPS
jgi:hypothetical protein